MSSYAEKKGVSGSSEFMARNALLGWEDSKYTNKISEVWLMLKGESCYEQSFLCRADPQRRISLICL